MKLNVEIMNYYLNQCENKRLSFHTLKAYRIDLTQFMSFIKDKDINKRELSLYIKYLNDHYQPKTVKRKLACIHAFLEHMVFDEDLEYNPMTKVKYKIKEDKRLPRIIHQEQLQVIFYNLSHTNDKFIKRDKAIIELFISTGIRVSELCHIHKEDISFQDQYLKIYGKGAKERVIFLGEHVLKALYDYLQEYEKYLETKSYFFINNFYQRLSEQSVRNIINKYTSGFHVTPHMFRHTFATMLLDQDVDISYIQRILGHSSITTTSIYAYASVQRQKEIMLYKNPRRLIEVE